jgi:hypothetical protein
MRVPAALEAAAVDYVVIGGVAVNFHGIARTTEDLAVFIAREADNVARLREALHSVFADPSIDEISAEDLCGEYLAVRYVPPGDGPPWTSSPAWANGSGSPTSSASATTSMVSR